MGFGSQSASEAPLPAETAGTPSQSNLDPSRGWRDVRRVPASIPETPPAGIALFDLDGTLIAWDCQLLFRHFVLRREPWRGIFLPVFLVFLPFAGLLGCGRMKRVFLSYLWRMDPEKLGGLLAGFRRHR